MDTNGILEALEKTGLKLELLSLQKRIDAIKKSYPNQYPEKDKETLRHKDGDQKEGRTGAEGSGEEKEA